MRLFYEVYGDGEPTVLLLPTWSIIHSRFWKAQIPYLARHFRVVTFDGRGNGRSDRPARRRGLRRATSSRADALAVMDATATERAVARRAVVRRAVGDAASPPTTRSGSPASSTSRPAVPLAPDHPERGASSRASTTSSTTDEGWAKYNRHYWLRDYAGFLEFFFAQMFTEPHSTKQIEDCVGWGARDRPRDAGRTRRRRSHVRGDEDVRATSARASRCPVLVIHGDDDRDPARTRRARRWPRRPAASS